jgi:hypothetical protein
VLDSSIHPNARGQGLVRRENNDAPIYAGVDGRLDAVSLGDFGLVPG